MPRRKGQRKAEPWYHKSRGYWCVRIKGRQIILSEDKEEAWLKYHELMAANDIESRTVLVSTICELFLRDCQARVDNGTLSQAQFKQYGLYLAQFHQKLGSQKANDLKTHLVNQWLESLQSDVVKGGKRAGTRGRRKQVQRSAATTGQSSVAAAVRSVRRVFNWAVEQDILKSNPVPKLKAPQVPKRTVVIDDDLHKQFLQATKDQEFRDVLLALRHTGCRSGEICRVTTEHVVNGRGWMLASEEHKTGRKTGRVRVVRLTKEMHQLTTRLLNEREPGEHLFLNTKGRAWTPDAIACRFTNLQDKLQLSGTCAYAYRHTAISYCVRESVDLLTVAELFGTSPQMIMSHYGHLMRSDDELEQAQEKAVQPPKRRRRTG